MTGHPPTSVPMDSTSEAVQDLRAAPSPALVLVRWPWLRKLAQIEASLLIVAALGRDAVGLLLRIGGRPTGGSYPGHGVVDVVDAVHGYDGGRTSASRHAHHRRDPVDAPAVLDPGGTESPAEH